MNSIVQWKRFLPQQKLENTVQTFHPRNDQLNRKEPRKPNLNAFAILEFILYEKIIC